MRSRLLLGGNQLSAALPNLRTPLVPKNEAWFTVRGQDFPNPEIASQILDGYGRRSRRCLC